MTPTPERGTALTQKNGVVGHFREHYVAYALALLLGVYTETRTEDRYTGRMGEQMEARVRSIEDKLNTLPPRELLERVTRLEIEHQSINGLSTENQRQWRQIEELQRERVRLETLLQSTIERMVNMSNADNGRRVNHP